MTLIQTEAPGAAAGKTYTYQDARPLAGVVVIFLWLNLAGHLAFGGAVAAQAFGPLRGESAELIVGVTALVQLLFYAVSGFLSLKWVYRAQRNAHALARGLSNSPPWAVGWFFIPIANLFKPYQAMKEAWQVSLSPLSWRSQGGGPIGLWWFLWLTTNIVSNIAFRLDMLRDRDMQQIADLLTLAATALEIPLTFVFAGLVSRLSAQQASAYEGDTFA
jgi:hypothetical protein